VAESDRMNPTANFDARELAKFSALAHRWWDPTSEFRPLHEINPLRLAHIERLAGGIAGKRVVDVGCGGGILSEAMAVRGADVTGIDLGEKPVKVAALHAAESGVRVDYRVQSAESLAEEQPAGFDVVTCMEMIEHVPDPASTMAACARLARPGGRVFFATINRNARSFLFAIVGAEYVLRMLPRGTHEYARFIRPSELISLARREGLAADDLTGMTYNPLTNTYALGRDVGVNYIVAFRK